ncbi:MAG: hypothetical protein JNM13_08025 [Hyphomicrobiaceae bacterium]|nr:hypothetical protein [Hyphomicrobiaceae bacterium]
MIPCRRSRLAALAATLPALLATPAGLAAEQAPKPEVHVFEMTDELPPVLRELGLAVNPAGSLTPYDRAMPNRCYYYGDGGQGVAFSDDFFEPYRARGFTRLSLCMGLVGGMNFDPETGRPIPRYSLVRRPLLMRKVLDDGLTGDNEDSFIATLDLPLAVPDCFRNATPYTDCKINFDMSSGKRLPPETTATYRKLGETLDRLLASLAAAPDCSWRQAGMERPDCRLAIVDTEVDAYRPDGYYLKDFAADFADAALRPPAKLTALSQATFFHVVDALPRGFGYALYVEGPAGPGIAVSAIKQGLDGTAIAPKIDAKSLIRKLNLQKN